MNNRSIWAEFVGKLKNGTFTQSDYVEGSRIDFAEFFNDPRWESLVDFIVSQPDPRVEQGEDRTIFKLKASETDEIRLDFMQVDDRWRLYMLDGLTIPVPEIPELPFAKFPPLSAL